MSLKVYNSLTRKKEEFKSIIKDHVGMYVCGPTVSGESHLGHARPYITFDIVNRYLLYLGYKVRYVRNITDARTYGFRTLTQLFSRLKDYVVVDNLVNGFNNPLIKRK